MNQLEPSWWPAKILLVPNGHLDAFAALSGTGCEQESPNPALTLGDNIKNM